MKKITLTGVNSDDVVPDCLSVLVLESNEKVVFDTTLPSDYKKVRILVHFDIIPSNTTVGDEGCCYIDGAIPRNENASDESTSFIFGLTNKNADEPIFGGSNSIFFGTSTHTPSVNYALRLESENGSLSWGDIPETSNPAPVGLSWAVIGAADGRIAPCGCCVYDVAGALQGNKFHFDTTSHTFFNVINSTFNSTINQMVAVADHRFPVYRNSKLLDMNNFGNSDNYGCLGTGTIMVMEFEVSDSGLATQYINSQKIKFYATNAAGGSYDIGSVALCEVGETNGNNRFFGFSKNNLASILINPTSNEAWAKVNTGQATNDEINTRTFSYSTDKPSSYYISPVDIQLNNGVAPFALPTKLVFSNPLAGHKMRLFNVMYMQVE